MMDWYGGMGWMMATSSVLGLALIGLVVWAIVRLTAAPPPKQQNPTRSSAREILDRRFASGEIDVDAYRRAVRELSDSPRD